MATRRTFYVGKRDGTVLTAFTDGAYAAQIGAPYIAAWSNVATAPKLFRSRRRALAVAALVHAAVFVKDSR